MVLVLEVLITVYGIMMIVRSQGMGKPAVKHPGYRWLGAFAVTVLPAAFAVVFVGGIIVAVTNRDKDIERAVQDAKWFFVLAEFATVAIYGVIVAVFDARLKKKALARDAATPPPMFDRFPAPKP